MTEAVNMFAMDMKAVGCSPEVAVAVVGAAPVAVAAAAATPAVATAAPVTPTTSQLSKQAKEKNLLRRRDSYITPPFPGDSKPWRVGLGSQASHCGTRAASSSNSNQKGSCVESGWPRTGSELGDGTEDCGGILTVTRHRRRPRRHKPRYRSRSSGEGRKRGCASRGEAWKSSR